MYIITRRCMLGLFKVRFLRVYAWPCAESAVAQRHSSIFNHVEKVLKFLGKRSYQHYYARLTKSCLHPIWSIIIILVNQAIDKHHKRVLFHMGLQKVNLMFPDLVFQAHFIVRSQTNASTKNVLNSRTLSTKSIDNRSTRRNHGSLKHVA